MVHQVRPGRGHQDAEAEQHAKGDQTVGDDDALAHSWLIGGLERIRAPHPCMVVTGMTPCIRHNPAS